MEIIKTEIEGLTVIKPKIFADNRGYFFESYNQSNLENSGINITFVQDNQSKSSYGVIRGLHYQLAPYSQTKLIRVLHGKILDVAIDLRKGSPTFGKPFTIELSDENYTQLLIPQGFAHGFSVLSDIAVIMYKCDNFYNPQAERTILFNDAELNINWGIPADKAIVSDKDKLGKPLKEVEVNFY